MSKHEPRLLELVASGGSKLLDDALRAVVAHFWKPERDHFEQFVAEGGEPQSHIFPSLQLLRDWIQTADPTWKPIGPRRLPEEAAKIVCRTKPVEGDQ